MTPVVSNEEEGPNRRKGPQFGSGSVGVSFVEPHLLWINPDFMEKFADRFKARHQHGAPNWQKLGPLIEAAMRKAMENGGRK